MANTSINISYRGAVFQASPTGLRDCCGLMIYELSCAGFPRKYVILQAAHRMPFSPWRDVADITDRGTTLHIGYGSLETVSHPMNYRVRG